MTEINFKNKNIWKWRFDFYDSLDIIKLTARTEECIHFIWISWRSYHLNQRQLLSIIQKLLLADKIK